MAAANSHDPSGMLDLVEAWPKFLQQGLDQPLDLPADLSGKTSVAVCGMGGSAIVGSILGDCLTLCQPYAVVRDYDLPGWVDSDSLVICVSHSGDTEETLAEYSAAGERGATRLVISDGGKLAIKGREDGVAVVQYDLDAQPRAALPLTLGLLSRVLSELEYVEPANFGSVAAAIKKVSNKSVPAKELVGRIPIVYGAGFLAEAARRLKGQFNENAKQTAAWEVLPELNHNSLVGYEFPKELPEHATVIMLRSDLEHPRHTLRFSVTKELLEKRGVPVLEIKGAGPDCLSQLCTVLYQGDRLSVELAYLNQVDPTPVEVLNVLKQRLANEN